MPEASRSNEGVPPTRGVITIHEPIDDDNAICCTEYYYYCEDVPTTLAVCLERVAIRDLLVLAVHHLHALEHYCETCVQQHRNYPGPRLDGDGNPAERRPPSDPAAKRRKHDSTNASGSSTRPPPRNFQARLIVSQNQSFA